MHIKKIVACFLIGFSMLSLTPCATAGAAEDYEHIKTHYVSASRGLILTREEFFLLAKLIHAEARGEPLLGQVAVGAVVFNRLKDPRFPKTITKVIHEQDQFSPVMDGSINLPPGEEALLAAELALNGMDPTNGCLYFYNPDRAESKWMYSLPAEIKIGSHVFC